MVLSIAVSGSALTPRSQIRPRVKAKRAKADPAGLVALHVVVVLIAMCFAVLGELCWPGIGIRVSLCGSTLGTRYNDTICTYTCS